MIKVEKQGDYPTYVSSKFKMPKALEDMPPEKIENVYQRAQYIAQIFVHGDSLQNELVAIVVPDVETVGAWAKKNSIAVIQRHGFRR